MSKETISILITEEIDIASFSEKRFDGVDICQLWPMVKPFLIAVASFLPKLGWLITGILIPAIDKLVERKCG